MRWDGIEPLGLLSKVAPVAKADVLHFCLKVFDVSQDPQ